MPPDTGLFDSKPLVATLRRTIDFERLNRSEVPLLVSAVDVERGSIVTFDTRKHPLEPAHFLATTAFTPGFPPVEIGGRCLADPGLISNLPIDALLEPPPRGDLLCFAVDLFDPRGARPRSLDTGLERAQDLIFAAQSMHAIEARTREHRLRHIIGKLAKRVPEKQRGQSAARELARHGRDSELTVVLIAYTAQRHEVSAKTLEFSRASVEERWAIGRRDMNAALDRLESGAATTSEHGCHFYDARRTLD
jgi:NTE family protein